MAKSKSEWLSNAYPKSADRLPAYTTLSDMEVEPVYTPEDLRSWSYDEQLGHPGEFPFTRGTYPSMYRGKLWTMRQFAGFEVIYTGLHQTPEMIAEAAAQEDVDAIGLSILSGAHMTLFPAVIALLKNKGIADVAVFRGGIVPPEDIPALKSLGVREIFTPGASTEDIIQWVRTHIRPRTDQA